MATEVGVKLKVDGIAQFKQSMTQGKAAVKQFDAQLKLNAAQFKQSGNQEDYLRKRTELLNQQIQAQEKVVQAAQKALEQMQQKGTDPASAGYQNMAEQLANAQTRLVEMRTALSQNNDVMEEGADAADELADKLDSIDRSTKFTAILSGLSAVKDVVSGVISGITSAATSAWNAMSDAADWADELKGLSIKYGLSTTELQAYEYAARFMNVELDDILKTYTKISKLTTKNGITYLGDDYGMQALSGDFFDQFWQVLDAISMINDEAEQDKLAQSIFGKSFTDLLPLIKQGRDEWNKYMEEGEANGFYLGEEDVETLNELNDAQEKLDAAWKSFLLNIAADFAPMFTEFADRLVEVLGLLKERMQSPEWQALIERIINSLMNVIEFLTDPAKMNNFLDKFEKVINKLLKLLGLDDGDGASHITPDSTDAEKRQATWDYYTKGKPIVYDIAPTVSKELSELIDAYGINVRYSYNKNTGEYKVDEQWLQDNGYKLAENYTEGVLAEAENAYTAGEVIGAEIAEGAAAAAGGSGGSPTYYSSDGTYIGNVNMYGVQDPAALQEQLAQESAKTRAGTGGLP